MISVVISAFNEEKNIADAIESAKNLSDEIIVVDNNSNDNTAQIAKEKGAKVFFQKNNPFKIDLQKNFGFLKASNPWIFSLDADERITPKLAQEVKNTLEYDRETSGYYIPRKNIIFGKWIKHSFWWPDYQLRLFKKGKGKFVSLSVHEEINIKGKVRHLSEPLIHESYTGISQYVSRMNNIYTEIEAERISKTGKKLNISSAVMMPIEDFLKTFFMQKGYKDGMHGLVLSLLQSFYTFLVFAKVWEKQSFYEKNYDDILKSLKNEEQNISYQIKYWVITSSYNESRNPLKKIFLHISRKLLSTFS